MRSAGKFGARFAWSPIYSLSTIPMERETLYIKKLSENATTPVRGSPNSAGYDLFR